MNNPLVSIIIPTYNRAHLIGETLDSILAQTYTNWECIVVDDGSTDNTANVLEEYCLKDTRIQYHHRPEEHNPGGNGARNYGFKVSKGQYVNWFDSDDLMSPNKLESQLRDIKLGFDMSICATGNFKKKSNKYYVVYGQNISDYDGILSFFCLKFRWLSQSPLISVKFLKNHGITFREELKAGQEFCYFCEILFFKPYVTLSPDIYVSRRVFDDSLSVKSKKGLQFEYFKSREIFIHNYNSVLNDSNIKSYWINYVIKFVRFNLENRNFKQAYCLIRKYLCDQPKFILVRFYLGLVSYFIFNKGFKIVDVKVD